MTPLSWRELLMPEYVLAYIEAFLLGALPVLGFASAVTNGTLQPHAWPTGPAILGAVLMGTLNGLRGVRSLRSTPPAARADATPQPMPAPPPAGRG
jgi:hypothetical protein